MNWLRPVTRNDLVYYAALGWTLVIFIGCSWPGTGLTDPSHRDKWIHAGIFLLFGFLWRMAGRSVWWVLLAGATYGLLTEIWQGVMPIHRSFDLYDALADTVGTVFGIALAAGVQKTLLSSKFLSGKF